MKLNNKIQLLIVIITLSWIMAPPSFVATVGFQYMTWCFDSKIHLEGHNFHTCKDGVGYGQLPYTRLCLPQTEANLQKVQLRSIECSFNIPSTLVSQLSKT